MTNQPMLTIEDFVNTFQQHTTLKAVSLLRDRFSKNITFAAQVKDVSDAVHSWPNRITVSLITAKADDLAISAEFDTEKNPDLKPKLLDLKKLDFINVSGVISSIAPNTLSVRDCTFEEIEGYEF
jgi:hypothetical protein